MPDACPGHGTPAFRGLVHTGAHGLSSGSMVHFPEEGLKAGHGADTGFTAGVCAGRLLALPEPAYGMPADGFGLSAGSAGDAKEQVFLSGR